MPEHPKVCVPLYCISCLLDAVDGNAARYFDQCGWKEKGEAERVILTWIMLGSKFGSVLDMVTDR